eukprot:GHVQ01033461.1.p1 GENE.GHVQ01033461.1~~GHVQ01033461.1.p1  ORF type:complete len:284 (-),score=27.37 GHVQ01033461.1:323-1174(-)
MAHIQDLHQIHLPAVPCLHSHESQHRSVAIHCYQATLAEEAERYDEMLDFMLQAACSGQAVNVVFTYKQCVLFSSAFRYVVNSRRQALRTLDSLFKRLELSKGTEAYSAVTQIQDKLTAELMGHCSTVLMLFSDLELYFSSHPETRVFRHKCIADALRYKADCRQGSKLMNEQLSEVIEIGEAYRQAQECASEVLARCSPMRLGLDLNNTVYLREIGTEPEKALEIARTAFNGAVGELELQSNETYEDCRVLLQMLSEQVEMIRKELKRKVNKSKKPGVVSIL